MEGAEKELVLLVVKREDKNAVMTAIMQEAGLESRAKSIVFSLPVTSTAVCGCMTCGTLTNKRIRTHTKTPPQRHNPQRRCFL